MSYADVYCRETATAIWRRRRRTEVPSGPNCWKLSVMPPVVPLAKPPLVTRRRIVISILLAACVVALWYGASIGRPDNKPIVYTDPAIKTLSPQPGDLALRQTQITATLASAYTLAQENSPGMLINGQGIAQDQVDVNQILNQYSYTPGPGKDISSLPPGRNCVQILIKRAADPADTGHSFSWCFQSQ
jgi:hypothetical protein